LQDPRKEEKNLEKKEEGSNHFPSLILQNFANSLACLMIRPETKAGKKKKRREKGGETSAVNPPFCTAYIDSHSPPGKTAAAKKKG